MATPITNSATPTTNYGSKTLLDVDAASQITYIQFDLGSIPSGASVSQATLKLYVNSVTTAGSFNVDYVNGNWSESTIDYSNAPPLGSTIASNVEVAASEKNHYILINVTPALVAWLDGSQANDGIALVANGSFNATFDSKENTTTSHSAELDVVFASSGGGTITGVLTAAGSGLVGGGTSGTLNLSLLNTCAANQVLQWNGSAWGCASVGTGTITGVTAGADLTGGGSSGNVTLNLDTTQVPLLAAANTFTGNQTANGNLSAKGLVTGSGYQIGSNLFAFGSYANSNAFLGFAGNTTTTGAGNTASGVYALNANTTGGENTAAGAGALAFNTTGNYNAASGAYALNSNTTGIDNTANGGLALQANTTGNYNTANGMAALLDNTTGHDNTANGYGALYSNTTAIYNTADGSGALGKNNTGSQNTAVGWSALGANTAGFNNVAAGWDSGNTLDNSSITGSNNTFVGSLSEMSTGTLTNATAIGAYAEVAESNAMVLGSINGVNGATANTNVGIGTTKPAAMLDVHGTGNFTGLITFAPGQTFPGTGTITGVSAGADLTGGGGSGNVTLNVDTTKVVTGVMAGTDLTGGGTGGVQTLNLDTTKVPLLGTANNFTGDQSITGSINASVAVNGGVVNSNSSINLGGAAFVSGSYLNETTFLGYSTSNGTCCAVTAVGFQALANNSGSDNVAMGDDPLYYNSTGGQNTAIGDGALWYNTTGVSNTAVGYLAGVPPNRSFTTGAANTFIGANSGSGNNTNLSNATAIGFGAEVDANNALVLGATPGVNGISVDTLVGVGITQPNAKLHVGVYNNGDSLRVEGPASAGTGHRSISLGGNGVFGVDAPGIPNGRFVVLDGFGGVGINTASPDQNLTVNGSADKPGGGSWGTYSDGRLKNVDGTYASGLEKVLKLRPVRYRYKSDNALGITDHGEHIGVVAQEVQRVLPEAVSENDKGYLLVNNDPIIWAMLNAVKEQQQQIKALHRQITVQQKQISALKQRATTLESTITRLQPGRMQLELTATK